MEEGLEKVQEAMNVCNSFMKSFYEKKGNISKLFKENVPVVEWSFNTQLIFSRLNQYIKRLSAIEVHNSTCTALRVIEGGGKG